jgi:tetratricopeptide (TPR) repeat protein
VNYAALKGLSEAGSVNEESGLFQRFFHWLSPRLAPPASDSEGNLDLDLRDLVARGLVHRETSAGRFDLHPIVRHYAYDRLAPSDRVAAHTRLRDYFATVPRVTKITRLEDLAPVIELSHHTARTGQFDEAFTLYSDCLSDPLYHQLGAYLLIIDLLRALFPDGEDPLASSGQAALPRLKDESHQAWTLNLLANSYRFSGQPHRAVPLFEQANDIDSKRGAKRSVAIGSGNVAVVQLLIGALRAAESNLHRNVALGNENYMQMQGVTWADRALRELLWLRSLQDSTICDPQSALSAAQRTLALADETARIIHPYERDYVRAHWLLGAAHRVAGQSDEAERHLHEALERCRRISLVEFEADILIDFARLRTAARSPPSVGSGQADEASSTSAAALAEAGRLAEEALLITERSGYVLQGADAHLELTKLALIRGDRPTARDHAQKARDLAYCDGPPDHTYKAAYEEALAQLKQLA